MNDEWVLKSYTCIYGRMLICQYKLRYCNPQNILGLQWRHLGVMASQITGNWTVCSNIQVYNKKTIKAPHNCTEKSANHRYIPLTKGQWCENRYHAMTSPWHDDVIKWKHFPRYWPFVRGIHRSPVNSPHKGQWHCVWINGWVNNREAADLRRLRAHYDVTVMAYDYSTMCPIHKGNATETGAAEFRVSTRDVFMTP